MRQKRIIIAGYTYHVTSRTNNKISIFNSKFGQRIILRMIRRAKEKYGFKLHNICIMPTHIHLLITPGKEINLSKIVQWVKTMFAKEWNKYHESIDHIWGERFFSRPIKDSDDFNNIHDYIDQNPVKAGLVSCPSDWCASGAYFLKRNIEGIVDKSSFN